VDRLVVRERSNDQAHHHRKLKKFILDIGGSVSETYGDQELRSRWERILAIARLEG
jgi:hypothetical protein